MRPLILGLIMSLTLLLSACLLHNPKSLTIEMYNVDGDRVGTALLSDQEDAVAIELDLEGLQPGFHAIHIHEYGRCEAPDFTTAGNHLNPQGKEHGMIHPEGSHLGDLPNIEADAGGLVHAELELSGASLQEGKSSLINNDGTALIVHEGQDDGMSQPGGDSGTRIVCGEIHAEKESGDSEKAPTDPTEQNDEQEE
ncbi:superoxide dismutase family protein [Oceanobacillus iheyensis]|uniref:superoxide dismutase family protein n=1 Tax=Oceanobacillus iheyensis TaxID=182710 RepID=UPI003631FD94